MKTTNEVRVIAFITNEIKDYCNPVPDTYLSDEPNVPQELIEVMKKNGWQDQEGNIWWDKDFQPDPVKADDGNVYLCLSDEDVTDEGRCFKRLMKATSMLN